MKTFFIALTLLFSSTLFYAQDSNGVSLNLPSRYVSNEMAGNNQLPDVYDGSPYTTEGFERAMFKTSDTTSYSFNLKYNAFTDQFEFLNEQGQVKALLKFPDSEVVFNGDSYIMANFYDNSVPNKGYFKVIHEGENKLLLRQKATFTEAQKARTTYGIDRAARIDIEESYYVMLGDKPAEQVEMKKREVIEFFSNPKVTEYIKDNRLKFRNDTDMVAVLKYYDSL